MAQFGVNVEAKGNNTYVIPNTGYVNPAAFDVECDASSASYPLAIGALTGGKVGDRAASRVKSREHVAFLSNMLLCGQTNDMVLDS